MDENKKAAQKKKISHFITIAVLVILFLAFIFPFIMVIINAFKTKGDITADPLALVGSHGFILTNFTDAMKKMNFATSFTNSLIITTTSTILTIVLAAMTAFVIVRNKWKACGLLFSAMIASMVIPFQVLMIPLVSLYGGIFGILNSRVTLIFMHVGFSLSMATFMFHGAIHTSIPLELEEAAYIDGCNRWQTYWKIVFPLLKPTIATVAIIDAMAFWNDYLLPSLVLARKELYTLPIATQAFYGTYSTDLGLVMAAPPSGYASNPGIISVPAEIYCGRCYFRSCKRLINKVTWGPKAIYVFGPLNYYIEEMAKRRNFRLILRR